MLALVVSALLAYVARLFRSGASLRLENLALRHQLVVYKQMVHRPRLRPTDRLFWVWLSRLWPAWQEALAFVQPRTVIAWQPQKSVGSITITGEWQRKHGYSKRVDLPGLQVFGNDR